MALSTVKSTFLGSATTAERDSQLVNRNLSPGTIFFNITTSTFQNTITGGNSPVWQDLSTQAFVGSEIGNITPASIGAPQTDGTGATGTWGVNITGNSSTVTTNANLTGPVQSTGNLTTIPNGSITNDMLESAAKPTFQNCYDVDPNFNLDINPFTIKAIVVTTPNQNSYSGTAATSLFTNDIISGFKFTASPGVGETMRVTHLQYADANFNIAFGSTREVAIYDVATENLLGQATVSKAGPLVLGFRTTLLASPVDLISGQEYTVVSVVPVGETAYSGTTLVPAPELTSVVLAVLPFSSVLVFPESFGTFANQIGSGGFEYELISNADVFSVSDETTSAKESFTVTDEPQIGKSSGLVLTGRADALTTINAMEAIKVSSATEMSFTQADDKDSICGISTTSAAPGELFKYVESGVAQGLMADGQSVTFGEFLRVSVVGKLRQDGGADAMGQAMQTVAAQTPGLPIMVHFLNAS